MDSLSGVLGRTEQLTGELTPDGQGLGGTLNALRTVSVPTSYNDLTDQPKINNVTLTGNKTGAQLGLASSSDIPTDLSDLDDDATHRLVTDTEKSTWNAKANVSDIPDISGKADKSTTLAGYGITNAYTKTETDGLISPITTKLSDNADWLKSKNLFNKNDSQLADNKGHYFLNGTQGNSVWYSYLAIPLNATSKISFSGANNVDTNNAVLFEFYNDSTRLNGYRITEISGTVDVPSGANKLIFSLIYNDRDTIQIEYGETITSYAPYAKSNVQITNELSNKTFTKRVLTNGTLIENDEIAFYYLRNGNGADIAPWASLDIDDLGFTPTFCSDNNGFLNGSDHSYAPGGYQVSSNKVIFQAYGTTIPTNSVPLSRTLVLFK